MGSTFWTAPRFTGLILIVGSVVFGVGGSLYMFVRDKNGPVIFGQPPREWLRLIFEHESAWRWATILFICGVLVTLAGFAMLAALVKTGGVEVAQLGLLALEFGAVLWILSLAARLAIDPWAARELATTGTIPTLFAPLSQWSGVLFVLYTILTWGGLMAFGGAFLASKALPPWLGWATIIYGVVGLGILAVTRDSLPILHYMMSLLIGIVLLLGL